MGYKVIGLDITEAGLEEAKHAGADHVFNSMTDKEYVSKILELTSGGVDAAVNFTASKVAYDNAPDIIRTGTGMLMVVGIPQKNLEFKAFDLSIGRYKLGVANNGTPTLMKPCIEFSAKHNIKPDLTIFKLEQLQEMIDLMVRTQASPARRLLTNDSSILARPRAAWEFSLTRRFNMLASLKSALQCVYDLRHLTEEVPTLYQIQLYYIQKNASFTTIDLQLVRLTPDGIHNLTRRGNVLLKSRLRHRHTNTSRSLHLPLRQNSSTPRRHLQDSTTRILAIGHQFHQCIRDLLRSASMSFIVRELRHLVRLGRPEWRMNETVLY
jgi:hypothetical protein